MKSSLTIPIKIKAVNKLMQKPVVLEPVFFMCHNGFQVKVVEGFLSGSIFCCKITDFEYGFYAKCQIWLVSKVYWWRNIFWRYFRYQFPYKVRLYFKKKNIVDDLPF